MKKIIAMMLFVLLAFVPTAYAYHACIQVTESGKVYCSLCRLSSDCWLEKGESLTISGEKVIFTEIQGKKCPGGKSGGFIRKLSPSEFEDFKRENGL